MRRSHLAATRSNHRSQLTRAAAIAAIGCGVGWSSVADGVVRSWTNLAGGTFSTPANWFNNTAPASIDTAAFELGAAAGSPYTVTFSAAANTGALTVNNDSVTFNLNGQSYNNTSNITIGSNASQPARLTLSSAGQLTGLSTVIGNNANASGLLQVNAGTASLGSLGVGNFGNGTLNIASGGDVTASNLTIGSNAGSAGTILIGGSGSTMAVAGNVSIGTAGSGLLTMTNGTSASSTAQVTLGALLGGSGTLQLQSGAAWTSSGTLNVGSNGAGVVSITGGSAMTSVGAQIGGNASATDDALGSVTIDGTNSRWTSSNNINIFRGSITLQNGGTLSCTQSFVMNPLPPAPGEQAISPRLTLHGPQTAMTVGSSLNAVANGIGSPTSYIDVNNGATLSASSFGLASATEATADVTVDGNGSQMSALGALNVASGSNSRAILRVDHAAAVSASGVSIGSSATAIGTITLAGKSSLSATNDIAIGGTNVSSSGTGYVTVAGGSTMSTGTTGTARIWSKGTLTLAGGIVSVGTLNITGGNFAWDSGTLAINGAAGAIVASNSSLSNRLSLTPGRTLAGNTVNINAGGQLTMAGGALRVPSLNIAQGGELNLSDESSAVFVTSLFNNGVIRGDGRIDVPLTNSTTGEVRAENGKRLRFVTPGTGSHLNAGLISMLGGEMEFDSVVTNTGRITGRGTLIARDGGVENFGTMTFSAGFTDVLAEVQNMSPAGKVIVTGGGVATFHDSISAASGSEIRVSTGSTAVFLSDVSGSGTITGSGVKIFEAGGTMASRVGNGTGTTRIGPAGHISVGAVSDNALFVEGTIGIAPNGTAASVTRVGTLSIDPSGQLDLSNNDAIFTSTSSNTVFSYLQSGYNFGGQDGTGGIVSSTARNNPNGNTALGMLTGQEYLDNNGSPTFDGVAVAPTDVLIKYTYFGDVDFNGSIDASDYNLIDFGFVNHLTGWGFGDADYSGSVDASDYNVIDFAFSTQNGTILRAMSYLEGYDRTMNGMEDPSLQTIAQHYAQFGENYAGGFLAAVPEPTTLLLAPAILAIFKRSRRRR